MKKIFFLLFVLLNLKTYSQDFTLRKTPFLKSKIIFNDGTIKEGLLRLASSEFSLRFKTNKKEREKKIDYKTVDKILTNPETKNERTFQYLHHNYNRYKIFVELISVDVISIYIHSSNYGVDLFYSDIDRTTIQEKLVNAAGFNSPDSNIIVLPNGNRLALPTRYTYFNQLKNSNSEHKLNSYESYLLKEGNPKLMYVERNKRFLKRSREYFTNCPSFIKEIEENKITLDDLPKFIEYYKDKCGKTSID